MIGCMRVIGLSSAFVLAIVAGFYFGVYIDRYGFDDTAAKAVLAGLVALGISVWYWTIHRKG